MKKADLYKWLLEAEEEIVEPRSKPALKHAKRLKWIIELWEDEMLARMAEETMKREKLQKLLKSVPPGTVGVSKVFVGKRVKK